jgi:hypothetical protein
MRAREARQHGGVEIEDPCDRWPLPRDSEKLRDFCQPDEMLAHRQSSDAPEVDSESNLSAASLLSQ